MSAPVKGSHPLRLFMTADAVGGVWQFALDLAHGLRPHGVETTLAALGPPPDAAQRAAARAAGVARLISTELPLEWTAPSPQALTAAGAALAGLAAECRPDLVHLNSPALAGTAPFPAPVVAVCHSCVATWWQTVRSGPLPEEFVWRTDFVRQGYGAAQLLAAPSAAFAAETARTYGLTKQPVVVRNGRRSPARGAAGLSMPQPFAFTAGRLWDEGKNLAALDGAAARVAAPVLAAGPLTGPNGARIELPRLRTLGPLDQAGIARHLRAGPVFVSTARYEPFGLAVLEAAQAGCALVLSDIPTFRELWDKAAVFVAPDDEEGIAAAIDDALRNPDRRARLGTAARERARLYSLEAMTSGYLAVYRSLLPAASPAEEAAA